MTISALTTTRTNDLTDQEVRSFIRRGYVLPGRLLSGEQVDALRRRLDELRAPSDDEIERFDLAPQIPFLTGLWKTEPMFGDVMRDPRLLHWSGQLMATSTLAFLLDNVIIKPPHVGGELHWHQDWQAWPVTPCEVVTAWIALEDVTLDNGAMQMIVGSHALGRFLPQDGGTGEPKKGPAIDQLIDEGLAPMPKPDSLGTGVETATIELKAGDVSLHHGLMWHRSGPNRTDQTRHSLIFRYADGAAKYSGKNYSAVDWEPDTQKIGRRLDELELFTVLEVPDLNT